MKVLHITNNFPTSRHPIFGIFVKEQIESLNKLNIDNEILFINGREKGKIEYLKSIFRIRKRLVKEEYDLIHCHHALSALCLILSGKSKFNKILVSFQNDPIHELGKKTFQFIKNNSNGWIFKNNSFYLPNGVNTELFKPIPKLYARNELNLDSQSIYCLFVSSNKIRKQKRYDIFSETIKILRNKYGYKNIQEIKLINTSREKIPLYFNAADLHLLTSDFEGSPNSVKESLACNTPVVSTNVGNVKELLNIEGNYVSNSNSPKELAKLAYMALTKNSLKGSEQIRNLNLDINSVALELEKIYKLIINKK
jgi:teichuronic acid biosynthesis glycosyltransferase TuaC